MAAEALDFATMDSAVDDVQDQNVDDVVDQTDDVTEEVSSDDTGGDGGENESQQTTGGEKLDGRRGPANIRNSIKAATEAMPEQAAAFKELGAAYFREQAFKQSFATPQDAASAKNLIESVGGLDGITNLQQRDAAFTEQDEALKTGNPEVLDSFFRDFPEGAAALAPHYLDHLAKSNPQALNAAVVPYTMGLLQNAGVGNHLQLLARESDPARQKQLVQELIDWYQQIEQGVKQFRPGQPKNPAADRLQQRETELNQREQKIFETGTNEKTGSLIMTQLNKTVEQFAKKNGWSAEQKDEFRNRLAADIKGQMDKDTTYTGQLKLRNARKDRTQDGLAKFISDTFVAKMNDKEGALATEAKVNKLFGRGVNPGQKKTGVVRGGQPKSAPGGGPIKISAEPPRDSINWNHPKAEDMYIVNEAYLKNGRHVRW